MFEIVYTVPHWYDGPREGIANFHGNPHFFASEWADGHDLDADTFLLSPVDAGTFELAMEEWKIWRRYETALHQGKTISHNHPALPEERERHEELKRLLEGKLVIDPVLAVRKMAKFRAGNDPSWSGYGWAPLEVEWKDVVVTRS